MMHEAAAVNGSAVKQCLLQGTENEARMCRLEDTPDLAAQPNIALYGQSVEPCRSARPRVRRGYRR
jgi:hypothetical protein